MRFHLTDQYFCSIKIVLFVKKFPVILPSSPSSHPLPPPSPSCHRRLLHLLRHRRRIAVSEVGARPPPPRAVAERSHLSLCSSLTSPPTSLLRWEDWMEVRRRRESGGTEEAWQTEGARGRPAISASATNLSCWFLSPETERSSLPPPPLSDASASSPSPPLPPSPPSPPTAHAAPIPSGLRPPPSRHQDPGPPRRGALGTAQLAGCGATSSSNPRCWAAFIL